MTSDPSSLLAWMRGRGPGDVTARAISDAGPRPFRRRSEADAALAVLIESGAIVEVSARPRVFRIIKPVAGIRAAPAGDGMAEPVAEQDPADEAPIPAAEVRALLADRTAHHAAGGRSETASRYMAARDTFEMLRTDARLTPTQITDGRCNVCGQDRDDTFLRVGGRVLVHARCLGEHRAAVAARVDATVLKALR